ncbi:34738_t:CDS:1, partial [Racocetra persica]
MSEKEKPKKEIPTVEEILAKVRKEENYSSNNNLYPRLMELALARHMEKANKKECQPDKCQ